MSVTAVAGRRENEGVAADVQGLQSYVHADPSLRVGVTRHEDGEQVDEEEVAAGLGPGWPDTRVLASLQQHCIALSYEACQHSSQGTMQGC